MEKILDFLRGSVRPVITYSFALSFVAIADYLVIRYGDATLALRIVEGFIQTTGILIAFWFGQRQNKPPAV